MDALSAPLISRREAVAALAGLVATPGLVRAAGPSAELVLVNGRIVTQSRRGAPIVEGLAIGGGRILASGSSSAMRRLGDRGVRVLDLQGRTVIPGLNDSHCHPIRGGRFYAAELRWDGLTSLARGLAMVREQSARTPPGQWVRVVGGWSPFQFSERRLPTPADLTEASPERPVFVLFLYSRGFLNRAGVAALGITPSTAAPAGGRYELTADGGAILHAEPHPAILYQTVARLPGLAAAEQVGSSRHYYRELNRFGLTSAIDVGGGGHAFPADYGGTRRLAENGELPIRISYHLFAQTPGRELQELDRLTAAETLNRNLAQRLENGFAIEGAGESLVGKAGDFENFTADRPDIARNAGWRAELTEATRLLLRRRWPIRIHATYGETLGNILDVFEAAHRAERASGRAGFNGMRWGIDHAETARPEHFRRIAALGGGIAVQNRMSFAGEFFAERYGAAAAATAPALRDIIELGLPLGGGTDSTRVSSYNPWLALSWLVTGRTLGGAQLMARRHRLSREEALHAFTLGSAWFSGEEGVKGRLEPGQYADLAVLSDDYLSVPEDRIAGIESVLTLSAGRIVHGAGPFDGFAPALPPIVPDWSPVARFGGWQGSA